MPGLDPDSNRLPSDGAQRAPAANEQLMRDVESRRKRLLRRQREGALNPWRSVGIVGVIGWSVALPTLLGVAAGTWIDQRWPSRFSWTLMLLAGGVAVGCAIAWSRIRHEQDRR